MFNNPCLLYHCLKDAERQARKQPDNNSGDGCLAAIGVMFTICLLGACIKTGGFGIVIAICIVLGIFSGLNNKG